jgi:DNA-binding NarL/FixJ family response regulator
MSSARYEKPPVAQARAGFGPGGSAIERLTPRELQVLRLIVEGKSNAAASRTLGLSVRSVETYRARVMHKLGLDGPVALTKYAIRHGIVSLD